MAIMLSKSVDLLPPELQAGVREYAELRSELQQSGVALGSCYVASQEFLDFLMRRAILKPTDSYGVRPFEFSASGYPSAFGHHVARVGNWCIDWTVRQYCWNADWPLIWKP